MRKLLFVVTLIFCHHVRAQDSTARFADVPAIRLYNHLLYNNTSPTLNSIFNQELKPGVINSFTLDFDYSNNSNAVPALFAFDLLFKGNISDALKDRVDNRIKNKLRFQDNLTTGATYQHYLKKWDGTIFFSVDQRQMRDISGYKQTYELLFYGNARFEGDSANLSHIRFQNFIYNQYTAGIKKVVDYGRFQMQFGVGLSFLQVVNNEDIRTGNNSSLYTAPYGEYLDIDYSLDYNAAREGATNLSQLNGFGVSGNFNLAIMNNDKWKLSFDVSDLGSITMANQPVNYVGTNKIRFQGIGLPNLTSFSSQTFDTLNLDSAVRSNLPKRTNNQYSVSLPYNAMLVFSKPLMHDRLVLNIGLQHLNVPGYNVYGYVKVNYFLRPDVVISGSVGAGGYTLCNLGFDFAKVWKNFEISAGSGNLLGLVLPAYYTGTGLYVRVAGYF